MSSSQRWKGVDTITKEEFIRDVLGMWTFGPESAKRVGHDAPFPRELPKRCIRLLSREGDVVLDPFLGSGTTMIEAVANGRQALGIEIGKWYAQMARERVRAEAGVDPLIIVPTDGGEEA